MIFKSEFREWVYGLWRHNCYERQMFGEQCKDVEKYFNDNKWWLKKQYKEKVKHER